MEEGQVFDYKQELVVTKCTELLCESIPGENFERRLANRIISANSIFVSRAGCILQMYVLLKAKEKSKLAIASIIMSALTAGVSGATISFE